MERFHGTICKNIAERNALITKLIEAGFNVYPVDDFGGLRPAYSTHPNSLKRYYRLLGLKYTIYSNTILVCTKRYATRENFRENDDFLNTVLTSGIRTRELEAKLLPPKPFAHDRVAYRVNSYHELDDILTRLFIAERSVTNLKCTSDIVTDLFWHYNRDDSCTLVPVYVLIEYSNNDNGNFIDMRFDTHANNHHVFDDVHDFIVTYKLMVQYRERNTLFIISNDKMYDITLLGDGATSRIIIDNRTYEVEITWAELKTIHQIVRR